MISDSNEADMTRTMAELARAFSAPKTLDARLRTVTSAAVDIMPAEACADILMVTGRSKYESVAPTSALPTDLDAVQERLGEGPCVEAAANSLVVRCDDLRNDSRWPRFAEAAVAAGVYSSLSFQLYSNEDTFGALNILAFEPNAFSMESESLGAVLAAHAALALGAGRTEEQLQSALLTRDIIGQAKGMIMERFDVDAVRAFELLTALSQQTNTKLNAVAAQIVQQGRGR